MSLSTISAETVNVEPLTAIQLAALRKCDDIVFRHKMGRSTIEAIKRAKPTATQPFHQEVVVIIPVKHRLTDYGSDERRMPDGRFDGFQSAACMRFNPELQTILALLRTGDTLELDWQHLAQSSPALLEAGVFIDTLNLRVSRANRKPGDAALVFHVGMNASVGTHRFGNMIARESA